MDKNIIVFAGPSLKPELKNQYPKIKFRGPVLQGDIAHEADASRENIFVIVDGYYKSVPSIWHKEIIYANNKGKIVIGCSSLGAIRAAELDKFGMIGSGEIYKWYKNNVITRDPDVAVAHGSAEENYRSFTVPIVNIKATLEFSSQKINSQDIEKTLEVSREIFFEHRTIPSLLKKISSSNLRDKEKICYLIKNKYIDQKQHDCTETLKWVDQEPVIEWSEQSQVEKTIYWNALLTNDTYKGPGESGLDQTKQASLAFQLCDKPEEFIRMRNQARLIDYSNWLAEIHGITCSKEEMEKSREEIIHLCKINKEQLQKELVERGMTEENLDNYAKRITIYRKIKEVYEAGNLYISHNQTHYRMMMLSPYWTTVDKGINKMNKTIMEEFYDFQKDNDASYLELIPKETLRSVGEECILNHLEKHPGNIEKLVGLPITYLLGFAKKYKFYEESIKKSIKAFLNI